MTMSGTVEFDGFDWDKGNQAKCQKHGVSLAEIEEALAVVHFVVPDPHAGEERYRTVGLTAAGRYVFVVFTLRGAKLRPISVRYMHAEEIANYEEALARLEER